MNFQMSKIAAAVAVTTLSATASVNSVYAAEEGKIMLEEVIVTAQKRAESVQDVPLAISAYSGDYIESFGITDVANTRY